VLSRAAVLRLLDTLDGLADRDAVSRCIVPGGLPEELRERFSLPGAFADATGAVLFEGQSTALALAPPFPVIGNQTVEGYATGPLRELLTRERTLAVVLLRLGGYSLGLFVGTRFVDTKTGGRFVKNRHRKGGQSQRRFERIREGQIREHFDDVAELIQARLLPRASEIDWLVLGGDRRTLQAMLTRAPLPAALAAKLHPRILDTPEPRLEVLERTPGQIWSSRAMILRRPDERVVDG
jgi:peptide subunit release factor 1 (eRF1)